MKKNYMRKETLILSIGILFMLSSCSITKCRYSNGFNIDFGGKKHESKSVKKIKKQVQKTEFCLTNQTDSNLIETSINPSENKTVLLGKNTENEAIITLSKKSIIPKLFQKKITKTFATKIKNKKITTNQKNHNNNYSILGILWEILKFILFCICFVGILYAAIIGFLILIWVGFWGLSPLLILLAIILMCLIVALLVGLLMQLFGYSPNSGIFRFFKII